MYSKSTMSAIGKAKISLVNPKKMESYLIDSTILAILLRYTVWKLLSRWSCWLCKLRTFCPLEKIHRPVTEREADEDYDRSLKSRLDRCRERIHCTKNLIYIKFTLCKFDLTLTWISRNRSTKLANLGFSLLYNIRRIRKYLSQDSARTLVHTDYCKRPSICFTRCSSTQTATLAECSCLAYI